MNFYDTRDGSCGRYELPDNKWWKTGVCVINNVLYINFSGFGLMWNDSELMLWRVVVTDLDLGKFQSVGMGEYYGKLAFLWRRQLVYRGAISQAIWCKMVVLHRSEEGIRGTA
ncbi:unnamed protein product [Arabidopsis arenosa]|uniref:Uncharacterized protein n=1 Tax=Arabidopsis arenosa TaxID=38785 RepID=A0A8S2AGQ5_ARAAE|nr:unnamed protein product [Arabidopsis arenosa]